jgi:xylulokinase
VEPQKVFPTHNKINMQQVEDAMSKQLLIAVDLGTSFIKAGVYDTDSRCVAQMSEPVKDDRPAPGIFLQKGEDLFSSAVNCLKNVCRQLGDRADEVQAIAFTGQMSGFMGVDHHWNDITTWSCSLDTRYIPYAEKQMKQIRNEFLEIGGTNAPQMAPKYEWFKTEFPEESKKIVKYLMISGYIIGRLGELPIEDAIIDKTYTQWTGLADISQGKWSEKICNAVGLDQKYLPKIVGSNYICGKLAADMAKAIGLKSGIPLVSGAGDKPAGCLGSATVEPGEMILEASSYGGLSCCVEQYRPDLTERRLDVIPSTLPDRFYEHHFIIGSGITLDWFINTFVRQSGEDLGKTFIDIDAKLAKIQPGSNGLMAVGLLGGSAMPLDGMLKGMWLGFDWSHGKEHFYRALLESFAFDFSLTTERLDMLYPEYPLKEINIIGGGAKSAVWTQMNADVSGKTYRKLDREDVAMWGAAMLAGNAVGIFDDLVQTARSHVKVAKEYVPDASMRAKYKPYMELYRNYVVEMHDFYKRLQDLGKGN